MRLVLFDRSIFHGERFHALKQSPLFSLVAAQKLVILYTSAFIEETLMFAQKNPEAFLNQWHFLVSLNRSRWFRVSEEILPIELGRRARFPDYQFLKLAEIATVIRNAPRLAQKGIPQEELTETLSAVSKNYDLRKDFRGRRINLRKQMPVGSYTFDQYFEANVDWFIKEGLMRYHRNSAGFFKVWEEHRAELGFTEKYLRSWFASLYLPLKDHSLKVDKNDRVDSEQLAFLYWADTFVSDDLHFLPRAFNLLYAGSDKELFTSEEFISRLESTTQVGS